MKSVIEPTNRLLKRRVSLPSITVNANSDNYTTGNIEYAGYTPIGIVGITAFDGAVVPSEYSVSTTVATVFVHNTTATAKTGVIRVDVLYTKD